MKTSDLIKFLCKNHLPVKVTEAVTCNRVKSKVVVVVVLPGVVH